MGLGSYSIMMKGASKEHHFQVKKEAVQDAQRMGIKPSARKWNIARNTMRTWLRRIDSEGNRGLQDRRKGQIT